MNHNADLFITGSVANVITFRSASQFFANFLLSSLSDTLLTNKYMARTSDRWWVKVFLFAFRWRDVCDDNSTHGLPNAVNRAIGCYFSIEGKPESNRQLNQTGYRNLPHVWFIAPVFIAFDSFNPCVCVQWLLCSDEVDDRNCTTRENWKDRLLRLNSFAWG